MTIRIVTDSTCDLPADTIARYGIQVVPLYINVGRRGYLDGIDITRQEFYQNLPGFPEHPTTAVPSPQKFHAIYDALAERGKGVLSIHISTVERRCGGSTSCGTGNHFDAGVGVRCAAAEPGYRIPG
jgi:DegV family protein with EDD domain